LKVEYVEETAVRKSLSFEIEAETLAAELQARAQDHARKIKLAGFRPGKVPVGVVMSRFRDEITHEAAEAIINRVVPEEIRGRGLSPVGPPEIADLRAEPELPLTFRAVFETLPLIDLPEYRGLEATGHAPHVTEDDVDKELARLRERMGRFEPVEGRAAVDSDHVVVDVTWREGDKGPEKRQEGAMLHVGSPDQHPDLNAALIGMTPGDKRSVTIKYADDAPPELAGKTIDYALTLKAVKQRVLPALDDELAKDLGEFESLSALRAAVRGRLEAQAQAASDRELREALLDALLAKCSFEVPETLVEQHMTARTENAARGLAMQGVDPSKLGVDWRQYRAEQREAARRGAMTEIVLDEIAQREGIEVLVDELETELTHLAQHSGVTRETLRRRMQENGDLAALRARIRTQKTLDLIKANARLTLA
jgi:trigger factor